MGILLWYFNSYFANIKRFFLPLFIQIMRAKLINKKNHQSYVGGYKCCINLSSRAAVVCSKTAIIVLSKRLAIEHVSYGVKICYDRIRLIRFKLNCELPFPTNIEGFRYERIKSSNYNIYIMYECTYRRIDRGFYYIGHIQF